MSRSAFNIVFPLFLFLGFVIKSDAQRRNPRKQHNFKNKFIGKWSNSDPDDDSPPIECLDISRDSSYFGVVGNQLSVECKNVYHSDTLYLYVLDTGEGSGFTGPKFYPPKRKSLFAKCFITHSGLYIEYTQKLFRDNIKTLELNTIFQFRHVD
jgi:hypothetical protein